MATIYPRAVLHAMFKRARAARVAQVERCGQCAMAVFNNEICLHLQSEAFDQNYVLSAVNVKHNCKKHDSCPHDEALAEAFKTLVVPTMVRNGYRVDPEYNDAILVDKSSWNISDDTSDVK